MPVFRGAWSATEIYTKLDIVSHNGSSYVARRTVTGVTPTDATEGADNWLLVAQAGGVSWEDLTAAQKAEIYDTIINEIFGVQGDRLTLKHNGNTVTFYDNGNLTTATHNLDTMQQAIADNATALNSKADAADVYDKTEIDGKVDTLQSSINNKAPANTVYTKTEINETVSGINSAINTKANAADVYSKDTVDTKVGTVATAVSTLAGNVYTKSEINSTVNGINQSIDNLQNNTYSRTYLDTALSGKANTEDTFPKIVTVTTSTASITISTTQTQNITYYCTSPLTSLTLAAVPSIGCENNIFFESGSTPTSFTYPNTLQWIGNSELYTVEANKKYAISILHGVAVMAPINDN